MIVDDGNITSLPPFPISLGITLTKCHPREVLGEMHVSDMHLNRNGVLHGGAIISLADTLAGMAATLNLTQGDNTTTVESKTNFLRPVRFGDIAKGICTPLHLGEKLMIFQTKIFREDEKLVAIVTQTQMTIRWEQSSSSI